MKTISELVGGYIDGSYTPTQAVADYLATIEEKDTEVHAFLAVYEDEIVAAAAKATDQYAQGEVTDQPLLGVPLAIKNNILVKDHLATAASKMLEHYTAIYDATIIERLRDAGAIFIGGWLEGNY